MLERHHVSRGPLQAKRGSNNNLELDAQGEQCYFSRPVLRKDRKKRLQSRNRWEFKAGAVLDLVSTQRTSYDCDHSFFSLSLYAKAKISIGGMSSKAGDKPVRGIWSWDGRAEE